MCQPGGGRWALGFGDRKHRRTAVETRSAAALGQQVLCCRWSARGSIKRAPANSQRPPACITTNQQPLGRAKSADGPASAASHRSNMAFLSTRTSTPPGRGPVNIRITTSSRRSHRLSRIRRAGSPALRTPSAPIRACSELPTKANEGPAQVPVAPRADCPGCYNWGGCSQIAKPKQ